jgi:hypothetical protein
MSVYADPRWQRRKDRLGLLSGFTLSSKLRNEGKVSPEFEDMMSNLTFEEVIALKLELSSKMLKTTFIGAPLWNNLIFICKDAILKYAYAMSNSSREASALLGIPKFKLKRLLYRFRTENYYRVLLQHKKRDKQKDVRNTFREEYSEIDPTL